MSIAGTVAKVAARVGGAAVGGPVGIAVTAASFLPLLMDLAKSGGQDPAKLDEIEQARNNMAERLVASEGISREKAMAIVNEQMKPLIAEAHESAGPSGGELLGDAAVAGLGLLAHKRIGRSAKAKSPEVTPSAEPAAVDIGSAPRQREYIGAGGARKQAEESAMRSGKMDSVSGGQSRLPAVREPTPEPVAERGFQAVPEDGGTEPMSDDDLLRMLVMAKLRSAPRRPPGAYNPIHGIEMAPETGRRLDQERMVSSMYGRSGD